MHTHIQKRKKKKSQARGYPGDQRSCLCQVCCMKSSNAHISRSLFKFGGGGGGKVGKGGAGDTGLGSTQAMATQKYTCKRWNSDAPLKCQPMKHLARSLNATASFWILTAAAATTTQKNFGYWHCCCFFPPLTTFSCGHTHTHSV